MLASVYSCAVLGVEGTLVEVEVKVSDSLEAFMIVGLPSTEVEGAKERLSVAITNSGYFFPHSQITVNLASVAHPKEGSGTCLPLVRSIAVSGWMMQSFLVRFPRMGVSITPMAFCLW